MISTGITFSKNGKNIFENIKAIQSDTTTNCIQYEIDFIFNNNHNFLQVIVGANYLTVSILFNVEDKNYLKWIENGYRNEFQMYTDNFEMSADTETSLGILDLIVLFIESTKKRSLFEKTILSEIKITQLKKHNGKDSRTIMLQEPMNNNVYEITSRLNDKKDLIFVKINNNSIRVMGTKDNLILTGGDIPGISSFYRYNIK